MFMHKTCSKPVLVFKHSEISFINQINPREYEAIRKKFIVGYYFGGNYQEPIRFDPDFYICIPGLNDWLRTRFKDAHWFSFSGFNFISGSLPLILRKNDAKCFIGNVSSLNSYILYLGDFQNRKGLPEAINFFGRKTNHKGILLVKVSSGLEKCLAIALSFVLRIRSRGRALIVVPHTGLVHEREEVFAYLKNSLAVLAPYKREGAARFFAEAEIAGKPVVFNEGMLGGTLHFHREDENIGMGSYSDTRLLTLPEKNRKEKAQTYLSSFTTRKYSNFLEACFQVNSEIHHDNMVDAFSGHRNDFPEKFTNDKTDEIVSFAKLQVFFASHGVKIGDIKLPSSWELSYKEKMLNLKKTVVKIVTYARVLYFSVKFDV